MKRFLLLALFCLTGWAVAQAQIPDGSIAPDFTGTDIDGNTHNLYDLLNAGKTVYIDVSATWCGPCWSYHNTHALRDLWETYGPDGTDEAYVMFIEGDNATNTACLYGPSGCVGGTQGDWVTGTPYPIIDDASIASLLQITYFPTIYCICPSDKKIYEAGQLPMASLWAFRNSHCAPPPVVINLNSTRNVKCINTSTGAINITPSGGTGTYTYLWSNGATTQDLNNIAAGTYTVSITSGGITTVSDPIDILQPALPLSAEVVEIAQVGCNGILGSITITGIGGWDDSYSYSWSNGQGSETATGLSAGTYKATITDGEGCTTTLTQVLAPAVYPIASIAPPPTINCTQTSIQLNGSGSDSGDDYAIQWFASNGGHIVSGGNTTTPTVDAAGNYTIQVTNTLTTCISYSTTTVGADLATPTANAGPNGTVSCPVPLDTLAGAGSSGSNFGYSWTGGTIVSGGTTLSPVVGAPGVYTLKVTNTSNGCTQTSTTTVTGFNTPPSVNTNGGALTCGANSVTLTTTTNSTNPTFAWTGPNGYTSNLQSPTVGVSGSYNVVLLDTITGCANNATANVISNTTPPGANATGGSLTCVISNVTIAGTSPDTNATFLWTGPNGFNSTLQSVSVSTDGAYNLVVTDPDNGCTAGVTALVALNTTPPNASAVAPGNLNCNTTQLQLNGTGSSQGSGISYAWTTTDGNIVSGSDTQTPLVDAVGTYQLLVSDAGNGCTSTAAATVVQSAPVQASVPTQTNVLCHGGASGAATGLGAGGNGTYNYSWSNGGNTSTISNLVAGVYVLVITDGENCSSTANVTITQPDILAANATVTGQTSNGVNDGTATANPSGGTSGYAYLWSNSETTQTIAGLAPGSYTVSVTDANGCTDVQTVTVNSFNCAISGSISGTDISCYGAANGAAAVTIAGGTAPFTYNWSNGATSESVTNLAAGLYTVNVADANNCPSSLSINIQEPTQLFANATATNESSAGANDGSATANPTGGSGNYTYMWDNGATTQSISGLAPGAYSVVVTDQNGCTSTQNVVVNSYSCAISTSNVVSNVTCAGAANGSITITTVGGEAPFTYAWSNGGSSATISNLAAGTYTALITDANQCQVSTSNVITEPQPYSPWDIQVTNPACPNDASGAASASISGGTMPYTFLWSNGTTGPVLSNVVAGAYTVQVTDANGCTAQSSASIVATDNVPPSITAEHGTVSLDNLGNATVTLATVNAQFSDNCGVASTTISPNAFSCSDLGEHTVTVTVTDLSGLTSTTTTTVNVVDTQAPVVTCPASMVVCSYDNFVSYQPATAQDNCLTLSGQWVQTSGLPSPSTFPVGTTVQSFTFTDASGNVGSCSFSITVSTPVVVTPTVTNDHNGQGVGSIHADVAGGNGPYTYEWTSDGQVVGTSGDLTGLGHGTYNLAVTDANGCKSEVNGIVVSNLVSAKEPEWLSGISLQPNPTSEITNVVFATPLSSRLEIMVIDATGRVIKTQISEQSKSVTIDCSEMPSGMYTLRFRSNQEIGTRKLMVIK